MKLLTTVICVFAFATSQLSYAGKSQITKSQRKPAERAGNALGEALEEISKMKGDLDKLNAKITFLCDKDADCKAQFEKTKEAKE